MKFLKNTLLPILILLTAVITILKFFKKPINKLSEIGSTISTDEANFIAQSLYNAMYNFGTDEAKIFDLLSNLTKPNFNKIYNSFGTKYYNEETGSYGNPLLDDNLDLWGWLNSELTGDEIKELMLLNPVIFT
ncbi:hypothetical protein [Polaribacter sp. Hel_I_88]|uniref:hypothetical protein n=1 Tax=Polaribacter sp. Hel_I_88 TaxID=1250006 RepID=UPI00047A4458|nr:hypothetical protein [Polaribacter sp. Hel_I_88]